MNVRVVCLPVSSHRLFYVTYEKFSTFRSLYCEERAYYRRDGESREDQVDFLNNYQFIIIPTLERPLLL